MNTTNPTSQTSQAPAKRNEAIIQYFGQPAKVACDRKCHKAWGINQRPRFALSDNPDDFFWLADLALGTAPVDPATYESGIAKPLSPDEFPNKWCVRECERCVMSKLGKLNEPLELPTFTYGRFNQNSEVMDARIAEIKSIL